MKLNPLFLIKKYGFWGTALKAAAVIYKHATTEFKFNYYLFKHRKISEYKNPTPQDLIVIEKDLSDSGIDVQDFKVNIDGFNEFVSSMEFPPDYHGGKKTGFWNEKLFEHYVGYRLLDIKDYKAGDIYVDAAACGSPWAKILREKLQIEAFAIDLEVPEIYKAWDFYKCEDATHTSFPDSSVKGISLHCAYEMFVRDDDIKFIREAARILKKGGKAVIVPLYMHTHYCSYSSPEYWGKGYSDKEAVEYIRRNCRSVPSSRKYDAGKLYERVIKMIEKCDMSCKLYVLRDKERISPEIYCYFIMEITK